MKTSIRITTENVLSKKMITNIVNTFITDSPEKSEAILTDGTEAVYLTTQRTDRKLFLNEKNEVNYCFSNGKKYAFLNDRSNIEII